MKQETRVLRGNTVGKYMGVEGCPQCTAGLERRVSPFFCDLRYEKLLGVEVRTTAGGKKNNKNNKKRKIYLDSSSL